MASPDGMYPLMIFPVSPPQIQWEPTSHMRFKAGVLEQKWAEQRYSNADYEWRSTGTWEWRPIPTE